jgi:hypothetical protein
MAKKTLKLGLSREDKARFDTVRRRAEELGVLDINFNGPASTDSLLCYERALDIIEKNKDILDRNAAPSQHDFDEKPRQLQDNNDKQRGG